MDIEDLSKTQLLLLTILVNFVVGIATGVLTVSLLDQAPTTVTQTVNRIVDHTIETVTTQVANETNDSSPPSTEELLTASLASNASRTVTIRRSADGDVLGRGFYIVTARAIVAVPVELIPDHVHITFSDGTIAEADRLKDSGQLALYGFSPDVQLPSVRSAELLAPALLKQGQTLIGLSADGTAVTGLLTKVDANGIHANVPILPAGSAAFTLSGDIAGLSSGQAILIPADQVTALLALPAP